MSEWQDISTAPKDRTRILVWDARMKQATIVSWELAEPIRDGDTPCWATDSEGPGYQSEIENVAYWQPLPPEPKE